MTLHNAIRHGEDLLRANGIDDPRWNAERLLLLALRISRAQAYTDLRRELSSDEWMEYLRLLARRAQHEPLAYIEEVQEFCGHDFHVNNSVLIPRPETEEIIRAALELSLPPAPRILDLGAGSGNIAVTLGLEIPTARVVALEMSAAAIPVLQRNAAGRISIVRGNLESPPFHPASFDLIVSNPPYVEEKDYASLPVETKHEPLMALVPQSVRAMYASLLRNATVYLKAGGHLIFEIGLGQEKLIEQLMLEQTHMSLSGSRSDFRRILRTFILRKS